MNFKNQCQIKVLNKISFVIIMKCYVLSKKVIKKRTGSRYLRTSKFKTSLQSAKQTKSDIQNFILHLKPFSVIEVLF